MPASCLPWPPPASSSRAHDPSGHPLWVPAVAPLLRKQARRPPASFPRRTNTTPKKAGCSLSKNVQLDEGSQDTSEDVRKGLHSRAPAQVKRRPVEPGYESTLPPHRRQYAARRSHFGPALCNVARSELLVGRSGTVALTCKRMAVQRPGKERFVCRGFHSSHGARKAPTTASYMPSKGNAPRSSFLPTNYMMLSGLPAAPSENTPDSRLSLFQSRTYPNCSIQRGGLGGVCSCPRTVARSGTGPALMPL